MSAFQLLGLSAIALMIAHTVRSRVRGRSSPRETLLWSIIWVSAAVAIAEPRITVVVARALGIARGADLVLYCAVLAAGAGFFVGYARLRQLEANLTRVVRHTALSEALAGHLPDTRRSGAPDERSSHAPDA